MANSVLKKAWTEGTIWSKTHESPPYTSHLQAMYGGISLAFDRTSTAGRPHHDFHAQLFGNINSWSKRVSSALLANLPGQAQRSKLLSHTEMIWYIPPCSNISKYQRGIGYWSQIRRNGDRSTQSAEARSINLDHNRKVQSMVGLFFWGGGVLAGVTDSLEMKSGSLNMYS